MAKLTKRQRQSRRRSGRTRYAVGDAVALLSEISTVKFSGLSTSPSILA